MLKIIPFGLLLLTPAAQASDAPLALSGYAVLPFVLLLLCIALLPLLTPRFWGQLRHQALIAGLLSLPVFWFIQETHLFVETGLEYLAFLIYLTGLYTVAGGIFVKGDILATPRNNTLFLAAGAVLANLLGTTGASMLLIRPMLTMNQDRRHKTHIFIFFIFIVSNIGGSLTPLGDPPLFLGFLRGVPFAWTLWQLWLPWLVTVGLLLLIFFLLDSYAYRRESAADLRRDREHFQPITIIGKRNFAFLLVILASILLTPTWAEGYRSLLGAGAEQYAHLTRDGIITLVAVSAYWLTPAAAHQGNEFSFHPLKEVAILFAGIFITMIPALLLLRAHGAELGITQPWAFFWMTGLLSSFLDNAPTYLAFAALAQGTLGLVGDVGVLTQHPAGSELLVAISLGAVFMGANTYIGNAPNFMVKNIVESRGVQMPSFLGYMRWSGGILIPVFALLTYLFLR